MVRRLAVLGLAVSLVALAGCMMPRYGAIYAPVMDTESAVAVGDSSVPITKVGEATAEGILFFAHGDASIKAAMESQGITRIHHVDSQELNVIGLYVKQTVRVYGD